MSTQALHVSVPVACFRVAQAREYLETYSVPPPSTVYGMLLSLVGEEDRFRHEGAELALAMVSHPMRSVVLRTLWRVKNKEIGPGIGANRRPDFQELLTGVQLVVWLRNGVDEERPSLAERVGAALESPHSVLRFGALSLGESTHLVDEVREFRESDTAVGHFLISDLAGDLALPVWPDHVGSKGTTWGQFRLEEGKLESEPPTEVWTVIRRSTPPS